MKDFCKMWKFHDKRSILSSFQSWFSLLNFCFEKFLTKVQYDCWPWNLETLTICWIVLVLTFEQSYSCQRSLCSEAERGYTVSQRKSQKLWFTGSGWEIWDLCVQSNQEISHLKLTFLNSFLMLTKWVETLV